VNRARPQQAPQAAAATDPGRERSNNEDRVLCEPELGIFAVIDGVGGESAGEVAAETALEVLRARLSRRTTDSGRLVREAIALANRQIFERAAGDPKLAGMACVLTVAVLDGAVATVGHVGDSRLYTLSPGEIRKVTPDHSPVGAREDAGDLSEQEAMRHPRRNEIFRDVGSGPHEPDDASWIDVVTVPFEPDTALLLCSDGLSDMIPSREILHAVEINAASPRAAVRALIERANAAGGKDNVSAVLVEGDNFAEAVRRRRSGGGGAALPAARPSGVPTTRLPQSASATAATGAPATPVALAGRAAATGTSARLGPGRQGAANSPRSAARDEDGGDTETLPTSPRRGTAPRPQPAGGPRGETGRTAGSPPGREAASVGAGSGGSGGGMVPANGPRGISGGSFARPTAGDRIGDLLTGTFARWLLAVAVLAAVGFFFRAPVARYLRSTFAAGGGTAAARDVLVVGIGDGGYATIGEALGQAHPGQTIEVAPGEYHEQIVLRDDVTVVSRVPRGAILLAPPLSGAAAGSRGANSAAGAGPALSGAADPGASEAGSPAASLAAAAVPGTSTTSSESAGSAGSGEVGAAGGAPAGAMPGIVAALGRGPAVLATGVHRARLTGFRIVGSPQAPWAVGVRLDGSEVTIAEVEITGALSAGIETRGNDRSTVRDCYIHHNGGAGVVAVGEATPRLRGNLIASNGLRSSAPAPGVEIRDLAVPLMAGNRIEANGGPGIVLPSAGRAEELFRWNLFGALTREQAVRVAAPPPTPPRPGAARGQR
jgi:serine/threonine protein phosphatase PrpC